ncbi:hypothetical protein QIS99_25975 [Streptomyces sp. B-S-A8]|uniref:Uncharacterized protein n=1 Tax=Streptomyces solicavernae TaxID=3043614 RepID=A0ABT6RYV2_9ACTN|nr:hypothetical protein [Streptomyces sp. B-S-A8]MDI3389609.1 hypothetical protein [Streptomyces sp. B-S-A8]
MSGASAPPPDVLRAYAALNDLAGHPPRLHSEADGAIRLELPVTPALAARWDDLLAVLDLGSSYGLTDTAVGQVAWTRFDAPGTA